MRVVIGVVRCRVGAASLCAEALASRGGEVTVFERDRCGGGASAGTPAGSRRRSRSRCPGPGVIGESLRWLVDPSGPLWIRPTMSPAMIAWIARFLVELLRSAYRRGLVALQQAAGARAAFDRLAERGVEFEFHDQPLLYPAFEQAELEHCGASRKSSATSARRAAGAAVGGELLALEPALSDRVIGGMIARGDTGSVRRGCAGVQRALAAGGRRVFENSPVDALIRDGASWIVESRSGTRRADAVVLAGGRRRRVSCSRARHAAADRGG